MSLDPTTLLATGGIAAVVAACWQQVKTVASYLSSFLVVRAQVDTGLNYPIKYFLKQNWKPLPSGILIYVSRYYQFRDRAHCTAVPFRVLAGNTVFRRGFCFLILSENAGSTLLIGIRGLIDFDDLIRNALASSERRAEEEVAESEASESNSRFQVIRVIGQEKGMFASGNESRPRQTTSITGLSGSPEPTLIMCAEVDISIDASFMYEKSQYVFDNTVDPFATLYFSDDVTKYLKQAQQWLNLGPWYTERGIPWRRGWLLYGPGGTGKSSLAKAVAQKLHLPVYQYFLATLSDQEFLREWDSMSTPCMALFEDFDTVFDKRVPLTEHKSLTFDCVLNQLSGVGSKSGIFLVVTTNHLANIDPAMGVECNASGISTRPGRIDTVIQVGNISVENRRRMAQQILRDWPEEIEALVNSEAAQDVTPVQFQEMLIQRSYEKLNLDT